MAFLALGLAPVLGEIPNIPGSPITNPFQGVTYSSMFSDTTGLISSLTGGATSLIKGGTGALTGFLSNPILLIGGGAVVLLILLK